MTFQEADEDRKAISALLNDESATKEQVYALLDTMAAKYENAEFCPFIIEDFYATAEMRFDDEIEISEGE